jgi:hypothetical protein
VNIIYDGWHLISFIKSYIDPALVLEGIAPNVLQVNPVLFKIEAKFQKNGSTVGHLLRVWKKFSSSPPKHATSPSLPLKPFPCLKSGVLNMMQTGIKVVLF